MLNASAHHCGAIRNLESVIVNVHSMQHAVKTAFARRLISRELAHFNTHILALGRGTGVWLFNTPLAQRHLLSPINFLNSSLAQCISLISSFCVVAMKMFLDNGRILILALWWKMVD